MIWLIMAIFAVANGLFRENFLESYLGNAIALSASGVTLCIIIFSITLLSFKLFHKNSTMTYLYIGIQWVMMTLIFEFGFGHFVIGNSWQELFQVFNVFEGNLFTLALLVSLFSPVLVSLLVKK